MKKTRRPPPGVLAAYRHVDAAVEAIKRLKQDGFRDLSVFTPVPNHEIAEALGHPSSPVRIWTLIGGLTGCFTGFAMSLWMSYDYPIVVGGKPLGSILPYVVIGFELTILFGALSPSRACWCTPPPGPVRRRTIRGSVTIISACLCPAVRNAGPRSKRCSRAAGR